MRVKFRRPSASMVVALLALFLALGGVSYAKLAIPAGSVGTAQLRTRSVTNHKLANGSVGNAKLAVKSVGTKKIIPAAVGSAQIHAGAVGAAQISSGAVGSAQISSAQVQTRVTGSCSGSLGAIGAIRTDGSVTCDATLPQQFGATIPNTTLSSEPATTTTAPLPPGPYLALSDPHITVSGGTVGSSVEVSCTLNLVLGNFGEPIQTGNTKTLVMTLGPGVGPDPAVQAAGTIPLALPVTSFLILHGLNPTAVSVSCTDAASAGSPNVRLSGTINAIQTESNS